MFPGIPGIDDIQDQNHSKYVGTLKDRFHRSYTLVRESLKAVAFSSETQKNMTNESRKMLNTYHEIGYGCSTPAGCRGNHPSGNVIMTVHSLCWKP